MVRVERVVFALMLSCALFVLLLEEDAQLGIAGPRYNASASMPTGVYWFVPGPVRRGDIVGACLPGALARYALAHKILDPSRHPCANGVEPIIKVLAAESGDVVDIGPQGVRINGVLWPMSVVRHADAHGHAVEFRMPPGRYRIAPDKVFLMGEHPRSWDSRYFGEVPRSEITGRWIPLITNT